MMKSIYNKVILFSLISLLCILPANTVYSSNISEDDINIKQIELYLQGDACQPAHLRKCTDEINTQPKAKTINTEGLDSLNISGSSQFSKTGFETLLKYLDTSFIIFDIDLRQEAHGFINGSPINWTRTPSNVNATLNEITEFEKNRLDSIKLNEELTYYNLPCKTVIPKIVESENTFINNLNNQKIKYIRFPVIDGEIPIEQTINRFVDFVNNQPKNSWLHFHCKEGVGRTTTFMIMYDILKNGKSVSLDDIITRQIALSKMGTDEEKGFSSYERIKFLTNFYTTYTK